MAKERRKNLSKAIYNIGLYSFTGLVIGYFLSTAKDVNMLIIGSIFTAITFILAYLIDIDEEDKK